MPEFSVGSVVVAEEPLESIEAADGAIVSMAGRRSFSWGGILLATVGTLVALALGLQHAQRELVDLPDAFIATDANIGFEDAEGLAVSPGFTSTGSTSSISAVSSTVVQTCQ